METNPEKYSKIKKLILCNNITFYKIILIYYKMLSYLENKIYLCSFSCFIYFDFILKSQPTYFPSDELLEVRGGQNLLGGLGQTTNHKFSLFFIG